MSRELDIFQFLSARVERTEAFRVGIVAVCLLIALAFLPIATIIGATRLDAEPSIPGWVTASLIALALSVAVVRLNEAYVFMRRHPWVLLLPALGALVVSGVDGWIRSGFYYPALPILAVAAVVAGRRLAFTVAAVLALGNLLVAQMLGFTPSRIADLKLMGDTTAALLGTFMYAYVCVLLVERETRFLISAPFLQQATPRRLVSPVAFGMPPRPNPTTPVKGDRLAAAKLSPVEREVLTLLPFGLTASQMAAKLGAPPRTVEGRLASAREKLGARNREHLVKILCDAERERSRKVAAQPAATASIT